MRLFQNLLFVVAAVYDRRKLPVSLLLVGTHTGALERINIKCSYSRWPILLVCTLLAGFGTTGHAQISLNVTNFGARGDCVQVWANSFSNSPVVVFTNILTTADIGKTVELFGVGGLNIGKNVNGVSVTNAQDLIATITNIINGTNVYISGDIPSTTSNGVYCIYGTNNACAFQAAVNAANGTNTIINIPAGTYLMIPPEQYTNFTYSYYPFAQNDAAILLNKGGIHFIGAGPGQTILMADGAFKNQGHTCMRGGVFIVDGPITNDYPLIWDSLTFDGGLQTGQVGHEGVQPADWVDGLGWDGFSFAGLDAGSEPLNTFKEFANCEFRHFRGEMIKGITGSARKETILVTNCFAWDGNATVFNYNFAHTITGCTFSNMYQIEEFYLKYPTNAPSFFVNNVATNIQHNLISLNGGTLTNEPYIISNNVFYCNMNGNGIATCPASSVLIASNQFIEVTKPQAYTIAIAIGQAGAQPGSADAFNTNIIIVGNTFSNPFYTCISAGGTSATDQGRAGDVQIYGNSIVDGSGLFLNAPAWTTNVHVFSNNAHGAKLTLTSGGYGSSYALVDTNNNYWSSIYMNGNSDIYTNCVNYGSGSRWLLTYPFATNATVVLSDTNSTQIPVGAQLLFTNGTWTANSVPVPIYLNSAMTMGPVYLPYKQTETFYWNGSAWVTTPPSVPASVNPPDQLRITDP